MNLRKLIATNNECYQVGAPMTPRGIMWHSTGANNPNLKRYVNPDDGLLGVNPNGNHFNTYRPGGQQVCVHAFIGKLANGSIATYQILPWNMQAWHCGGSANQNYIGFEICEDGLNDKSYFDKVYKEAVELTAHLCELYNINPNGANTIICHQDGARLGIASNHADVYHWFNRFGKTMVDVRKDVTKAMNGGGQAVSDNLYRVRKSWADSKSQIGAYKELANAKKKADDNKGYNVYNSAGKCVYPQAVGNNTPFTVKVAVSDLNIRKGAGTDYAVVSVIKPGVYTITEVKDGQGSNEGWGKLKSGAGWISLDFANRL